MNTVHIELAESGRGQLWVNDHPMHHLVRGFTLTATGDQPARLVLELVGVEVSVDATGVRVVHVAEGGS